MLKIDNSLTLSIIFFCIAREFFFNTSFTELQILFEFLSLLIFAILSFYIKFEKYEIYILISLFITLLISFPILENKMFFLSTKNIFSGYLPLLILPKLNFNKKYSQNILNIFLLVNIILTIIHFNINFFPSNIQKSTSASGILQNYHYNGFIIGVYAITTLKRINIKQLILGFSVYRSTSKTCFVSYFLSLVYVYKDYFLIKVKQIKIIYYKLFGIIIISLLSILVISNTEIIKNYFMIFSLIIDDKSSYIIFDQLTNNELFLRSISILPGNVEEFDKFEIFNNFSSQSISNEITIYFYLKTLGLINFLTFCFLIFKNCKKLIPFFLFTSFHYSYLLSPLVYLIFFIFKEENSNLEKNLIKK